MFKQGFVHWSRVDSVIFMLMVIAMPIGWFDSMAPILINDFNFSKVPTAFYFFLVFVFIIYTNNWLRIIKRMSSEAKSKEQVPQYYWTSTDEKVVMSVVFFFDLIFFLDKGISLLVSQTSNYHTYLGVLLLICCIGLPFFYLKKMKSVELPLKKEDEH